MPRKQVAATPKFTVVLRPEGTRWNAEIPEVQGCRTWGRSLSEVRRNIRGVLATCSDVFKDADAVARDAELVEDIKLPKKTKRVILRYRHAKQQAEKRSSEAQQAAKAAATALLDEAGVSLRDAGDLLELSGERIRQLRE